MNTMLGQVVYSRAGRDEGRIFVICGMIDENFVFVCDGDLRRVENPKKKKIRHLKITNKKIEALEQKLTTGIKITNAEVRKALVKVTEPEQENA